MSEEKRMNDKHPCSLCDLDATLEATGYYKLVYVCPIAHYTIINTYPDYPKKTNE